MPSKLDEKESLAMIQYLFSLRKLSSEWLLPLAEHIGAVGCSAVFRFLCECKENPMSLELRERALTWALEERQATEEFIQDCVAFGLFSREEEVWALSQTAGLRCSFAGLLEQKLQAGDFSLQERVQYPNVGCMHREMGFLLFTVNVPDTAETRFWALMEAVDFPSEEDNTPLIRQLFAHYNKLDGQKEEPVRNYGLSQEQWDALLVKIQRTRDCELADLMAKCSLKVERESGSSSAAAGPGRVLSEEAGNLSDID